MDSRELSAKAFAEHLHTRFEIQLNGREAAPVELVDVAERHDSPKLEQFSVVFFSGDGRPLPQAIYQLEHPALGRIELFLVPIGPRDGKGMEYQAVFNRFRKDGGSAA
jgi:hypothetical protein